MKKIFIMLSALSLIAFAQTNNQLAQQIIE